ncbi:YqzG/YhdC family protein [Paenibacillus sp. N1-5-1-14]|uniref:YqzG/YhdC family protein n=1 Tax=Paenibacillus radicibacter TaxID=2972488 RepID=UPI002158EF07|nr:YqzG/YhdC family protein [Paenibacillus radicibacter]MCR8644409.1 YqzG/YhdC family protein [Paenibacillus radicibacter]
MRKIWMTTLLSIGILLTSTFSVQAVPAYAKWGNIAMQETLNKYHTSITDYQHLGRTQIDSNTAEEKFKLKLKKNHHEFTVFVTVHFHLDNEQLIAVYFQ